MAEVGPVSDTAVGDVVVIQVSPDPPYGVIFEPDTDGCAAVIKAWERLPKGKFGPLQKHGGLHYGDVLIAVGDTPTDVMTFSETMMLVKDRNLLRKTFKFISSNDHYRKKRMNKTAVAAPDKNNFRSIIRRCRVGEDSSSTSKFGEYEVACQFRVTSMRVQKEIVYKWSVWRRFSDFEKLHAKMKRTLGWQMESIEFPSSHTFVMNKLAAEFLEQRREELATYWQKVLVIDKITEFGKHHCSPELKEFLEVEEQLSNGKPLSAPELLVEDEGEGSTAPSAGGSSSRPRSVKGPQPMRRRASATSKAANGFNFDDGQGTRPVTNPPKGSATSTAAAAGPAAAPPISAPQTPAPAPQAAAPTPVSSPAAQPPAPAPVPTADDRFGKFTKMLNMGLPEGAVRIKMAQDGVGHKDIDAFFGGGGGVGGGAAPPPPPAATPRAPAPPPQPAVKPAVTSSTPAPTPTPARMNLLGAINALRKE